MIDMKQLLADREAGTPGPLFAYGHNISAILNNVEWDLGYANFQTDARRFARVPELEQALIDARAALEACRNLFAIMIRDHDDEETIESSKIMLAICKKGLGE